jgi:hypothetical protein
VVLEKLVLKTGGTSDMGDSGISSDPASMSSPGIPRLRVQEAVFEKLVYSRLAAPPQWETPASPLTQPACPVQVSEVLESRQQSLRNLYSSPAAPQTWEIPASPLIQPACPVYVRTLRVQEAFFEKLVLKTGGTSDMGDFGISSDPASMSMSSPGK